MIYLITYILLGFVILIPLYIYHHKYILNKYMTEVAIILSYIFPLHIYIIHKIRL